MGNEITRIAHVKWAGPNTPFIRMADGDRRLYLKNKRELVALFQEIDSFLHYYRDDFKDDRIDNEDDYETPGTV